VQNASVLVPASGINFWEQSVLLDIPLEQIGEKINYRFGTNMEFGSSSCAN
jgi:hypothetical protein